MTLLPDWKDVLKRAWSVKFLTLAAVVSGCETVLQVAGNSFLPAGVASAIVGVLAALGILARVLAQHEAEEIAGDDAANAAQKATAKP
jgi:uncharacterized membrane protein